MSSRSTETVITDEHGRVEKWGPGELEDRLDKSYATGVRSGFGACVDHLMKASSDAYIRRDDARANMLRDFADALRAELKKREAARV